MHRTPRASIISPKYKGLRPCGRTKNPPRNSRVVGHGAPSSAMILAVRPPRKRQKHLKSGAVKRRCKVSAAVNAGPPWLRSKSAATRPRPTLSWYALRDGTQLSSSCSKPAARAQSFHNTFEVPVQQPARPKMVPHATQAARLSCAPRRDISSITWSASNQARVEPAAAIATLQVAAVCFRPHVRISAKNCSATSQCRAVAKAAMAALCVTASGTQRAASISPSSCINSFNTPPFEQALSAALYATTLGCRRLRRISSNSKIAGATLRASVHVPIASTYMTLSGFTSIRCALPSNHKARFHKRPRRNAEIAAL
mmetsp:Transcript_26580/g.74210  ORF Transcript_26580/g.74210 Transcript_26580/m.74210 type:complete len:313 (-) Transcript_26580:779-1717(-)